MRRKYLLLLFLFAAGEVCAQTPDDEYYPYSPSYNEDPAPLLQTDSTLFYRAVQSTDDLYGRNTAFSLPRVALNRRGNSFRDEQRTLSGIELSWSDLTPLRQLGAEEQTAPGIAWQDDATGRTGGTRSFRFADFIAEPQLSTAVHFTDRNYLAGVKISYLRPMRRGWNLRTALSARTGRDMHVEGVFTNALTAALHLTKRLGEAHTLGIVLIVPPSLRGTRLSSVEEAFSLTGDPLYNPAWGFQNGRVRNSRVRRDFMPFAAFTYGVPLGASTHLDAALGIRYGYQKYSSLGWYDARTPMPDNYRYLPSYTHDRETENAWRSNLTRFTQVAWDELIAQNRMSGDEAVYALEDRVERLAQLGLDALFTTRFDNRLTLRYGLHYSLEMSRNYKQMRDLLGASRLVDIDQYLVDDDTYGNKLQNDLRHPNRSITRGDRFAYDYALLERELSARLVADYRADRFRAGMAVTLSGSAVYRRGYYEKELFPGAQSYGQSRRMKFMPYTVKALVGWAFTPHTYLEASAAAGASTPRAADLFYQPLYNNRTIDRPTEEHFYAAELKLSHSAEKLTLHLGAFVAATLDAAESRRYYDDMANVYCDLAIAGIGRIAYGLEAAADIRLAYRWHLSFAASAGRYKYIRNPRLTVISDVDNTLVDYRAVSRMGGCQTGASPQFTAAAELGYFGRKGWGFHTSAGYAGGRYVEPMPLRRTPRIARQTSLTHDAFDQFTRQERLGDVFTLDASLFKTFYFDRSRLTLSLMLRNLLGTDDAVYNGYESMRIRRTRAGDATYYAPHATRYTYAYPRSFYLSVTFKY